MAFSRYKYVLRASKTHLERLMSSSSGGSTAFTNSAVKLQQNALFDEENARQLRLITRLEKIQVSVKGPPEDSTLIMNKGLSTPFNCAMHIGEQLIKTSAIALVNGREWDMHRPLTEDCELRFMHFLEEDPRLANKAYWRSCSFLLGYIAEKAFKDDYYVELHSWPSTNIFSGSFVYDVNLKMGNWEPKMEELRVLSLMARKLFTKAMKFERLNVDASVALNIFAHNKYKCHQIPKIAASSQNGKDVILYRLGDHIDISCGPMIANSGLVGTFTIAAIFPLNTEYGTLHRFQGVSLPSQIFLNSFAFDILVERAAKVNPARVPSKLDFEAGYETPLHKQIGPSMPAANS